MADLPERIANKIYRDSEDGCWLWTGAISRNGYGNMKYGDRWALPHRVVYELLVGPIPVGLCLDHLCRVRHCVNPAHLEPVTMRENLLRGTGVSARNHAKKVCPRCGNDFTTIQYTDRGKAVVARVCRPCNNAAAAAAGRAKRAISRAARIEPTPAERQAMRDARRARRCAQARGYYHEHHAKSLARMAAYRDANRELIRAKARAKHAELVAAKSAAESRTHG